MADKKENVPKKESSKEQKPLQKEKEGKKVVKVANISHYLKLEEPS